MRTAACVVAAGVSEDTPERDAVLAEINNDDDGGSGSAAAAIPTPAGAADDVVGAPVKD